MKITIPIDKKKGHRTAKTEVIHIRFNQRMRSALEIAARMQNQSVSGFIDSTLDTYIKGPALDSSVGKFLNANCEVKPETFSEFLEYLWDADEVVRFLKLAEIAPSLLTDEEDRIWSFLRQNDCFKLHKGDGSVDYNVKLIRFLWNDLMEYANTGKFTYDALRSRLDSFIAATNISLDQDKLDMFYSAWQALWSDEA